MDFQYTEPSLDRGERVLGIFYGNYKQWGGKLIVTNLRVLYSKLDLAPIPDILVFVGGQAGIPGVDLGKQLLDYVDQNTELNLWLEHVTSVEPDGQASLFAAPRIRLTTATGQRITISIVKAPTTMSRDPENNVVRDGAVALLRLASQAARQAAV